MDLSFFTDLLDALNRGELTAVKLLEALSGRGPVSESQHHAEIDVLSRAVREATMSDAEHARILAQLRAIQQADDATIVRPGTDSPVDDATIVRPRGSDSGAPADDAEVTVFKPASGQSGNDDDDATIVKPSSRGAAPSDDDGTRVRPFTPQPSGTHGGASGTHTGTGTSSSRGRWQRVAAAEGGEYAEVGTLLKGRFLLEREIGRGGMGVVYLARDERKVEARDRDPYVAVKVLNDEFRRHPDSLIALQRESRRSQQLAHDNIVRVYDFDKDGTIVFMTMEYVAGSDLKTLIREQAFDGMPLANARPLIYGMARALRRAHAAGVVHSDFKPGNVMVTPDGVPKVFDFGLARAGKHVGDIAGDQTVFDAGTLGALTPTYASLEMLQGAEPTPSDDIYALGCVTFELLTGKHPFDKVSAEVAQREGRVPPPVPQLTRRQYKTLCDSVAFRSEDRLENIDELIEGLRDVSWRERYAPWVIGAAVVLVLGVAGAWGVRAYLHQRHITRITNRFKLDNPHHYANADQASAALDALDPQDRAHIVLDKADLIQRYLLARVDTYWNPAQGHYDYARAQHVFQLRNRLKLFSPKLDSRRQAIEQQRNSLLNRLDTQLSDRIDAGAIFPSQPHNVVETLRTIRAINPQSALLNDSELEFDYDIAVGKAIQSGDLARARKELAVARKEFPHSSRLAQRVAQLQAMQPGTTPAPEAVHAKSAPMSTDKARTVLASLLAHPSVSPGWRQQAAQALGSIGKKHLTRQERNGLAKAVMGLASARTDSIHLPDDLRLTAFGLEYAPHVKALKTLHSHLETRQQQVQSRLQQQAVQAQVKTRIESVRRAVAADDTAKAVKALARIKAIDPGNAFVHSTGPDLVAGAYLDQAQRDFRAGHDAAVNQTLTSAVKQLGRRKDLVNARKLYDVATALVRARGKTLGPIAYLRLHRELGEAGHAAPGLLKHVEADLKARGDMSQQTLAGFLASLQGASEAETTSPESPGRQHHAASSPQPAPPASGTSTAAAPGRSTQPSGAGATHPHKAQPAPATQTASNDPCARPGLPGSGRLCDDHLDDGHRGPRLVVIPGSGGGRYAMTRSEITAGQFDLYCRASKACSPPGGSAMSDLPVTNVTVAQARAYARWLTKASGGHVYRLPTEREWLHAAHAGKQWSQSPDSNCLPPGSDGSQGTGGAISARGRQPNPWGLINMTGNVWEWVTKGHALQVRGGSYTSYWSDCTVSSHRADSGAADGDVGFRLVREIQ